MKDQAEALEPGLYVVATPIGNLEDLGFRALRVLRGCRWIAAEDTRETRKLLTHYAIPAPALHALHAHSTRSRVQELAASLQKGGAGVYVSDAGTPGLCDPGAALVRACLDAGVRVVPVPGASAPMALLSVLGREAEHAEFHFRGFFPRENRERKAWAELARRTGSLQLFFESPHRIRSTLRFLGEEFPADPLVVGRELTKRFETISRGSCRELFERLGTEEPRGEYVLALELAQPGPEERPGGPGEEKLRTLVKELALLGAGQKLLVRVAMSHGLKKNEAYRLALEVLEMQAGGG